MTDLTGQQTCDATKALTYNTGAGFMTAAPVTEFGLAHGYADMHAFYLAGRCGVLGDVDSDVVAAAFGFFNPEALRGIWETALRVRPAREAASLYTQALTAHGGPILAKVVGPERLAELIEKVVDAASPAGLPLFAGWRAAPRPSEPAARAVHAIHLLREWRGSAYVAAVSALALDPLDAVMLNGGEGYAKFYMWPEPWGDGHGQQALSAKAEQLTDGQCAPVFEGALHPADRGELADLLQQAASAADG